MEIIITKKLTLIKINDNYKTSHLSLFFSLLSPETLAKSQPDFTVGIKSTILNEQRSVLIYTPYANTKTKPSTTETYPVLYVLDGENHFRSVVAIVERPVGSGACPPIIVVGIPNKNRTRDLTPTISEGNSDGFNTLVNNFGYRALNQKQYALAKELFEMNVLNFPEEENLLDSLGDYYNAIGDTKNAIVWYQKTLAKKEISETREKLNSLLKVKK